MDLPPVPLPRVKSPPYHVMKSVAKSYRTYLYHKVWNYAMEATAFIAETFFSSAQGSEIFCKDNLTENRTCTRDLTNCLWHHIFVKLPQKYKNVKINYTSQPQRRYGRCLSRLQQYQRSTSPPS